MKEQVTRIVCDGLNGRKCGTVIAGPADGIVINGTISNPSLGAFVIDTKGEEVALCWAHFHERCPGAVREREVVREVIRESPSYERNYNYEPGTRPTGPLPPPEMPHCVEVVRVLCDVR